VLKFFSSEYLKSSGVTQRKSFETPFGGEKNLCQFGERRKEVTLVMSEEGDQEERGGGGGGVGGGGARTFTARGKESKAEGGGGRTKASRTSKKVSNKKNEKKKEGAGVMALVGWTVPRLGGRGSLCREKSGQGSCGEDCLFDEASILS